jgi:hypothetical protein
MASEMTKVEAIAARIFTGVLIIHPITNPEDYSMMYRLSIELAETRLITLNARNQ